VKRLWVQQTLAFSVIVLITMGAVVVWINRSASAEFRKYITLREIRTLGSGIQELVVYYQQRGSWEGVESLLAKGVYFDENRNMVLGTGLTEREWLGLKEEKRVPNVLLVDAGGRVVYDSEGKVDGKLLSRRELSNASPITEAENGDIIGYLLLFYPVLDEWEQQFLDKVEYLLLVNAALAVGLIVVVGALLSRRLNAPLQRLAAAARAVAAGDLDQQVQAGGSIEVAQVGQAFNEMTAALQEAETLRQNMVSDVAHELRTPISVLQGNLWAILNDAYPLEKAEISRLYDETRLLSRLVDDLRDLALADAGRLGLDLRPIDVAQVVSSTVDNLALAIEAQEVILSVDVADNLPPVQADADRLAQVLRNLLVNALRHTPAGGSIAVSALTADDEIEIRVADTGEGIAAEDLARVFDRFWKADRARGRSEDSNGRWVTGSGLGLSVAQGLVAAHSGRIWAESIPGRGATFHFTLPLA
jgi:two-component system OmpR family sensor kinase